MDKANPVAASGSSGSSSPLRPSASSSSATSSSSLFRPANVSPQNVLDSKRPSLRPSPTRNTGWTTLPPFADPLKRDSKKRRGSRLVDEETRSREPLRLCLTPIEPVAGSSRSAVSLTSVSPYLSTAANAHAHPHADDEQIRDSRKKRRICNDARSDLEVFATAPSDDNSIQTYVDECEQELEIKHLNKVLRATCDEVSAKNAEIAQLRQELATAEMARDRELSIRQQMFFNSMMERRRAERELSSVRMRLGRHVLSVKAEYQRNIDKLEEISRKAAEEQQNVHNERIAKATQDLQEARTSSQAAWVQLQHTQDALEHSQAVLKVYEGDVIELQRIHNEESAEREFAGQGLPPSYDSIPDVGGYLTPYGANKARDAGPISTEGITGGFLLMLQDAMKSLSHFRDPGSSAYSNYMLFHNACFALINCCRGLQAVLHEEVESEQQAGSTLRRDKRPRKADNQALSGESTGSARSSSGLLRIDPATSSECLTGAASDSLSSSKELCRFKVAASVVDTIFDLCYRALAVLEMRPTSHDCQFHAQSRATTGMCFRLVDDLLLMALKMKADSDPPLSQSPPRSPTKQVGCPRCESSGCAGYCLRLQNISHDLVRLKGLKKALHEMRVHGRSGTFFPESTIWLRDMLETERQTAANAVPDAVVASVAQAPIVPPIRRDEAVADPVERNADSEILRQRLRIRQRAAEDAFNRAGSGQSGYGGVTSAPMAQVQPMPPSRDANHQHNTASVRELARSGTNVRHDGPATRTRAQSRASQT